MYTMSKKELDSLLSIIPNHPMTQLFHLNDNSIDLSQELNNFAKREEFEYDVATTDEKFIQELKESIENKSDNLTIHKLNLKQHRYNRHSKLYDFAFITMDIDEIDNLGLFLKKLHTIIKNSGYLLLFLEKEEKNMQEILQLLEDKLYVAINPIEISDQYQIVSAKKMHGWGN